MKDFKKNKSGFENRKKNLVGSSIFLQRKNLLISFFKGILRIPKKLDTIILILRDIEYQLSLINYKDQEILSPLLNSESSRNSQNGEDGVIQYILEQFSQAGINFEKISLKLV